MVSLAAASLCFGAHSSDAAPMAAKSADHFVDSIGVNVHAHGDYVTHHEILKTKLGELGVRYVRDGAHNKAFELGQSFFAAHGIRTCYITGRRVGGYTEWKSPLDLSKVPGEIADIKTQGLAHTVAIEGPNEYDLFSDSRETDWPGKLRKYQQAVFEQVKADPDLRRLPVIGPSLTSEGAYISAGSMDAWMDRACVHHYQSWRHPGTGGWGANGYGSITWMLTRCVSQQSPAGKPVWNTECGYSRPGTPEHIEGIYAPRMFAEFYRRGYEKSFKYELLGDEWGLLRGDLTERPAFSAVKNLIALLGDPGAAFTPGSLDYTFTSSTSDVRQVLLQKRHGVFYLLLWRETSRWNGDTKVESNVAPANVTLDFNQSIARVDVFQPNISTAIQQSFTTPATISLSVPDQILIVRIRPPGKGVVRFEASGQHVASSGDRHRTFTESTASGGICSMYEANAVGDFVTYAVPGLEPGAYRLKVRFKRWNNRARFRVSTSADGGATHAPWGGEQEGYASSVSYTTLDLGGGSIGVPGAHWFRLSVSGKHGSSRGYWLPVDYLQLEPQ